MNSPITAWVIREFPYMGMFVCMHARPPPVRDGDTVTVGGRAERSVGEFARLCDPIIQTLQRSRPRANAHLTM